MRQAKFYATLGQRYRREPHPKLNHPDPDGVIAIHQNTFGDAHYAAVVALTAEFCSIEPYNEGTISKYYPHGVVAHILDDGRLIEGAVERVLTLQPVASADGQLPYPFHVDEHGHIGRQDFWKGTPERFVCLVSSRADDLDYRAIEHVISLADLFADPSLAKGMYLTVTNAGDTAFYTSDIPLESASVRVLASSEVAR